MNVKVEDECLVEDRRIYRFSEDNGGGRQLQT
jgi:hypothetical protein